MTKRGVLPLQDFFVTKAAGMQAARRALSASSVQVALLTSRRALPNPVSTVDGTMASRALIQEVTPLKGPNVLLDSTALGVRQTRLVALRGLAFSVRRAARTLTAPCVLQDFSALVEQRTGKVLALQSWGRIAGTGAPLLLVSDVTSECIAKEG